MANRRVIIFIVSAIFLLLAILLLKRTAPSTDLNYKVGSNGVWEDVQPFIDVHSPTINHRKALEQLFQAFQQAIVHPEICLDVKEGRHRDDLERGLQCYWKVFGHGTDITEPKNAIINTMARARAWAKFSGYCSGGIFHEWDEKKDGPICDFENK
jgi:hypothetical protein